MIPFILSLIDILSRLFNFVIIVHVVMTYFMSPFHPIRQRIDRIVEPFLLPIRRIIPTVGMIDFSPLVLILLVQLVSYALRFVLLALI